VKKIDNLNHIFQDSIRVLRRVCLSNLIEQLCGFSFIVYFGVFPSCGPEIYDKLTYNSR
jgi:hypothetical protein